MRTGSDATACTMPGPPGHAPGSPGNPLDDPRPMSYLLIPLISRTAAELPPLREALRSWVTVVATAADPCLVLDRDGRIAGVSTSAAALVDEEPAALVGRRLVGDVFAIVDFSAAAQPLGDRAHVPPTQALAAGVLSRGLIRIRRPDGTTATLDAISAPLHDSDGAIIGSLTFFAPVAGH